MTLEWETLQLATAKLLSLTIWRNGQRLAAIPNPLTNTSTKLSGLEVDTQYAFHLVLRTSAGIYVSNHVKTRTHTIANTSGIRVCFGAVMPPELLDSAKSAIKHMKADFATSLQIDTTHFVCTSPGSSPEAPNASQMYQKALHMSIPTVLPSWLDACAREGKMVPIAKHYLGSNATAPGHNSSASSSAGQSRASLSRTQTTQPSRGTASVKSPVPRRSESHSIAASRDQQDDPAKSEAQSAKAPSESIDAARTDSSSKIEPENKQPSSSDRTQSVEKGLGITSVPPETPSQPMTKVFEETKKENAEVSADDADAESKEDSRHAREQSGNLEEVTL